MTSRNTLVILPLKLQLDLRKRRKIPSVEEGIARFLVNRYEKA